MADSPQKTKKSRSKAGRAAELLGDWRAAERDEAAAIAAAKVAGRALEAALAAEHAALVAEKSAKAAADAVKIGSKLPKTRARLQWPPRRWRPS